MQLYRPLTALLLAALLVAPCAYSAPQWSDNRLSQGQSKKSSGSEITAGDAAAEARRLYGGRVLGVEQEGNGYRVRILQPSGRVIQVHIGSRGSDRR